ncbi:MAG: response regulator transcription factor [bacterium]|nr:response regulator transcription factor [bacterium]
MLRVLMVSDTRLYREGVAQILAQYEAFEVTPVVGSSEEILAGLERFAPDVVLLDTGIPDALSLVREIGNRSAGRVVALGLAEVETDVVAFAEAGIAGYVGRDASIEELISAIESAMRQELCCSRKIAGILLRRVAVLALGRGETEEVHLTPREHEVVALLEQGLMNKEIARDLHVEVATVKNHVHNILDKLGVHTRGEAVARVRALNRFGLSAVWTTEPRLSSAERASPTAAPTTW